MSQELHNQRYGLMAEFAQVHLEVDEHKPSKKRKRRLLDRAWNILQEIKKVSHQLAQQPPPAPPESTVAKGEKGK